MDKFNCMPGSELLKSKYNNAHSHTNTINDISIAIHCPPEGQCTVSMAATRMRGSNSPMRFPGIIGIPIHRLTTMVKQAVHKNQRKSSLKANHHSISSNIPENPVTNQPSCVPNPGHKSLNNIPRLPEGKFFEKLYNNLKYCMIQSGTRNTPIIDMTISVIKNQTINVIFL